jgi:hypothetical protein
VATNTINYEGDMFCSTLVTTGTELMAGKHYWEVEILNDDDVETTTEYCPIFFGVTRPSWTPTRSPSSMLLDSMGNYTNSESTDGWFYHNAGGGLCGNGKINKLAGLSFWCLAPENVTPPPCPRLSSEPSEQALN